jgi:RNA polymerase sigma-70 factor, ECF subfamily
VNCYGIESLRFGGLRPGVDYPPLSPEELVSACCQSGNEAAWTEFIHRFQPLIASVAIRIARRWNAASPSLIDDLVQETYVKLCADNCRLLRRFESRQPDAFYGFLKVVTANVVHDHFKATHAAKRGSGHSNESVETLAPDSAIRTDYSGRPGQAAERLIVLREIDQQLGRLIPIEDLARGRLIFWLYYRSGLSASAIASLPSIGLTTKGVESVLLRLTRSVRTAFTKPAGAQKERQKDSAQGQKGYGGVESL